MLLQVRRFSGKNQKVVYKIMANEQSRSVNSIRNTVFAAIAYVVKLLAQFVVRFVFIRYFVAEYLGVNGLFTNILNVLSLAELGVGNAIVYSMYKPIAENDTEKIKSLVRLYRNLYLIIALVIIVIGLALIPALPFLIKDAPNVDINLTVVYLLFLAQTAIGYFFAYRRSLVFAYQRNDVESKVSLLAQCILAVTQILIIIFWKNFYAYTAAFVLCNALDAIIVFAVSYKLFPEIRGKAKKLEKSDSKIIAKNTGAMVCHKLGSAIVFSTDSIIISAFIGAAVLGYYSNYTLITAAMTSVVNLAMTAIKGSIGNLIAQKGADEVYKIYQALNFMLMWLVGFIAIGLIVCFQHFIRLYTGQAEYVLGFTTMILLCVSFYLTQSRAITNNFKECAGLFWNDRFKPLFESGINLGLDFLLVYFMGINGVIIATIISTIAAPLWIEPYVLYKHYFKESLWHYFVRYLVYTVITLIVGGITYAICYSIPSDGLWWFLLRFAVCIIVPNALFLIIYFKMPEFKYLFGVIKSILHKKKATEISDCANNEINETVTLGGQNETNENGEEISQEGEISDGNTK
ncbi:MAG: oligosaccharide flippase family protein [Clostridia bacterium]|nr:oligosaccharide flippase family protein [Clostridia bacterium]